MAEGKTSFGPPWLLKEIQARGPGDYMVVTPTFPLLELKALPTLRKLFEHQLKLGEYQGHPVRKFTFSKAGAKTIFGHEPDDDTIIYFGHASDPESLESATAKGAWLDECGQTKFRLGSFEAIMRRLSLAEGRVLSTTTPYARNWIYERMYLPWEQNHDHPEIDIVRFDSTENPSFPKEEFERARRDLPAWRFDMFYRARFTRPAGLIYDSFDRKRHQRPWFQIPDTWTRFLGLDFGGVNTAGIFLAEDPISKQLFAYREYGPIGGRTARQHVEYILAGEPKIPICVGGAKSEGQWRGEFQAAGLPVAEPEMMESTNSTSSRVSSIVEVGINRVYAAFSRCDLIVLESCKHLLDEISNYSRKIDEAGNPLPEIEDKNSFHLLDGLRYIISHLRKPTDARFQIGMPQAGQGSVIANAPAGVFRNKLSRGSVFEQEW